jgi:hypothetical protein
MSEFYPSVSSGAIRSLRSVAGESVIGAGASATIMDDYEGTDLASVYTTTGGSLSLSSTEVVNGSQSLQYDNPDGSKYWAYTLPGDGLDNYFKLGTPFKVYVTPTTADDFPWFTFALDPTAGNPEETGYLVRVDTSGNKGGISLWNHDVTQTNLDSLGTNASVGVTYEIHGLVQSDGTIDVDIRDVDTDTEVGSLAANDNQWTAEDPSGFGYYTNNSNGSATTTYWDFAHQLSEKPSGAQ